MLLPILSMHSVDREKRGLFWRMLWCECVSSCARAHLVGERPRYRNDVYYYIIVNTIKDRP